MNGRIWVESEPGAGSVFHFTARFAKATSGCASCPNCEAKPPAARPLRILLAEDNVVNQRVTQRMLEKRGHRIAVAADGNDALRLATTEPFDLILMDSQMPGMDGLEATRRIRASEGPSRSAPIVAVTAHAMNMHREECLRAGMDEFIAKPIHFDTLFRIVERIQAAATSSDPCCTERPG